MGVKNTSNNIGAVNISNTGAVSRNPISPNKLSQTPKNFSINNYYLKELQDKVDASWNLRPNHVDIEQEVTFGLNDYISYEVVAQSVKTDTGTIISDDWRRFVFRDIRYDCAIGTKFRVAPGYDINVDDDKKFIFLVTNKTNEISATNAVVVRRCNGTLGSVYLNDHGLVSYHYEPAIQEGITNTGLHYDKMANDPSAALTVIVQHNEYTSKYFINQRFVIGYDRVYRITNIDKFYSNNTYDPKNVGLITLYMAIDSIGERDDFENRIAYNDSNSISYVKEKTSGNYHIVVALSQEEFGFDTNNNSSLTPFSYVGGACDFCEAYLYDDDERLNNPISIEYSIEKVPQEEWSKYVEVDYLDGHLFQIIKKRYCAYNLLATFYIAADDNPSGTRLETVLTIDLSGILSCDEEDKVLVAIGDVISIENSTSLYRVIDRHDLYYTIMDISSEETSVFNLVPETITFSNDMVGQKYKDSIIDGLMSNYYENLDNSIKSAIIPETIYQDIWYHDADGNPVYQGVSNNGADKNYQISNARGTAEIGERYCYALSVQDILKYLGTTSHMSAENTTLRYNNIWQMFWYNQTTGTYSYPCLRSAQAKNSLRAFAVDGRNGGLNGISYDYTFLFRPAFTIDLTKVNFIVEQESPIRSADGYYFIVK